MVSQSDGWKYCIARSYHCGHSESYGTGGTKSRPSANTCDAESLGGTWVDTWLFDESPTAMSIDSACANVLDMKQNMTTAVKTRRRRDKRWGYEGITSRFREVN